MSTDNYLFISDLQIPFQHERALQFCKDLKKDFDIPDENVYNVGDEIDGYYASMFKKCPDARSSPTQELEAARDVMKEWYAAFPKMKISTSNHGERWKKKALDAEIPSIMMRKYQEVLEAPASWQWKKSWLVPSRHPMLMIHGDDFGGPTPHLQAAMTNGLSVVLGHHHSVAGVEHFKSDGMKIWGLATGSLIDFDAFAFNYARASKRKPLIGCGVVIDGGSTPVWIPLPE